MRHYFYFNSNFKVIEFYPQSLFSHFEALLTVFILWNEYFLREALIPDCRVLAFEVSLPIFTYSLAFILLKLSTKRYYL